MDNKVLVTGDLHLFDFANHNLFGDKKFRLNQFPKLARRLVDIGKTEQCNDIVICGDIVHHATVRPYIQHVLREVFAILSEGFENVYYILGQHDMDSRAQDLDVTDSVIGIVSDFTNVHHMSGKVFDLWGVKAGFCDWKPDQANYDFLSDSKPDLMFGHLTISSMFGQEFDSSQYKLGFFGDIHSHGVVDNNVKIGVPIQGNLGDNPDVGVVILDTSKKCPKGNVSWKRVPTIVEGEWDFLRIVHDGDDYPDSDWTVKIKKSHEAAKIKDAIHKSVNPEKVIEALVVENALDDIHKWVMNNTPAGDYANTVDMNFDLETIVIKNFRSIEEFEHNFKGGVTYISGLNGSGKSSFIRAVMFALQDYTYPKRLCRRGEKEMEVRLTLSYQGNRFTIIRGYDGSGYTNFEVNDVLQEKENNKTCSLQIRKDLPFIDQLDLVYFNQERQGFLSSYGYSERVKLMDRVIGLGQIEAYSKTAVAKLDIYAKELAEIETKMQTQTLFLNSLEDIDESILTKDITKTLEDVNAELIKLDELRKLINRGGLSSNEVKSLQDRVVENKARERTNGSKEEITQQIGEFNKIISDFDLKIREWDEAKNKIKTQIATGEQHIKTAKSELVTVTHKLTHVCEDDAKCYACTQRIDEEKKRALETSLTDERTAIESKIEKMNSVMVTLILPDEAGRATLVAEKELMVSERTVVSAQLAQLETSLRFDIELQTLTESLAAKETAEAQLSNDIEAKYGELKAVDAAKASLDAYVTRMQEMKTKLVATQQTQEATKGIIKKRDEAQGKIDQLLIDKQAVDINHNDYARYCTLMGNKGTVISSILEAVSEEMSTDDILVRAFKVLSNGETRPDFTVDLNVDGDFIPYDELSGGQKTRVDLTVLKDLLVMSGVVGLLVLDETLRQLDPQQAEAISSALSDIPANNLLICTHVDSFPYFDRQLSATLTNRVTHYDTV